MKSLFLSLFFLQSEAFCNKGLSRHAAFVGAPTQQRHFAVTTRVNMFGGLFGGGTGSDTKKVDGELALYPNLGSDDVKYDSLSDYIEQWSKLFESDPKGMQLTTPVKVLPANVVIEDDSDVVVATGNRLVFKSTDTGYMSRNEEDKARGGQQAESGEKSKKKGKLQGGVEILVEKLTSGEVRVRARRCDVDEDTIIKEMSEEAILDQLKIALDIWKREVA